MSLSPNDPFFTEETEYEKQRELTIRREERERCARVAKLTYEEHCARRDDLGKAGNIEGSLTAARQAQTADDIFKLILALPNKDSPHE